MRVGNLSKPLRHSTFAAYFFENTIGLRVTRCEVQIICVLPRTSRLAPRNSSL